MDLRWEEFIKFFTKENLEQIFIKETFAAVICLVILLILSVVALVYLYKDKEQIEYAKIKNGFCDENQIMEFENADARTNDKHINSARTVYYLIYVVGIVLIILGLLKYIDTKELSLIPGTAIIIACVLSFIAATLHSNKKNEVTNYIPFMVVGVIALILFGVALLSVNYGNWLSVGLFILVTMGIVGIIGLAVPSIDYNEPDYATIIDRITTILENSNFIQQPSAPNINYNYFLKTNSDEEPALSDLYNSIVKKYTAYKEEQNKNTYYTRSDIDEELKSIFNSASSAKDFATKLVRFMNFPYDARLLNSKYQSSLTDGVNCDNTGSSTCIPTRVPYKTYSRRGTPLYLTWFLIIIVIYFAIHMVYKDYKFSIVITLIVILASILLGYLMSIRNNI